MRELYIWVGLWASRDVSVLVVTICMRASGGYLQHSVMSVEHRHLYRSPAMGEYV